MKRLLLVSLLLAATSAYAGPPHNNGNGAPSANAGAIGLGVGVGVGIGGKGVTGNGFGGNVGDVTASPNQSIQVEAPDYGDLRQVPPAIAPSVFNSTICPIVMQGSGAGSVFFISLSGTSDAELVPICVAYQLKQYNVVEAMTCNKSKEYRQANPNCAKLKAAAKE